MKSLPLLLALFLLSTGLLSCNKRTRSAEADRCPPATACDRALRPVLVRIRNGAGGPVVLDDFKTIRNRDGKTMRRYQAAGGADEGRLRGVYTVLSDGTAQTERDGLAFTFVGYQGGKEVVRNRCIIGHDCCHLRLLEGATELTLGSEE